MSQESKPVGIVLIALWSGLFGLACVPVGCTAALLGGLPGAAAVSIVGLFVTALGVMLVASAYGLWTLQPWGRTFTWWVYLVSIPLGAIAIFPGFPGQQTSAGNTALQLIGIAIDLVIIAYLAGDEVIELFESDSRQAPLPEFVRREPQ